MTDFIHLDNGLFINPTKIVLWWFEMEPTTNEPTVHLKMDGGHTTTASGADALKLWKELSPDMEPPTSTDVEPTTSTSKKKASRTILAGRLETIAF